MPRQRTGNYFVCEVCGTTFYRNRYDTLRNANRFCSKPCQGISMKGEKSRLWKGGSDYIDAWGYHIVSDDDGNEIREHRLVMQRHLGRKLTPDEHVHHKPPGNKLDNRLENLVLTTQAEHPLLHTLAAEGRWSRRYERCVECGTTATRHYAHGQCKHCYEKAFHSRKRASLQRSLL